jgi:hypothetical protein
MKHFFLLMMVLFSLVVCDGCAKKSDKPASPPPEPTPGSGPPPANWKDVATGLAGSTFLGSENGVVFYAFDALATPGKPVRLLARLLSVKDNLAGVKNATLGFFLEDKQIGDARTVEEGYAGMDWMPPKIGIYDFQVRIIKVPDDSDQAVLAVTPAPLLIAACDKNTRFVVIDLDHTIVDSNFFTVLLGGGAPMPDSVEVTHKIAEKYGLIYLTQRPDLMTFRSKSWLRRNGYPLAPLLVSTIQQAVGASGAFKTGRLDDLRKEFPGVAVGIGDKLSDAQAYVDNGLTAYWIPHYKNKPKDMRRLAWEIRQLDGNERLQVVSNWRDILAGIELNEKFPPGKFADSLEIQAQVLEEQKKKNKDKDD